MKLRSSIIVAFLLGSVFVGAYLPKEPGQEKENLIFHAVLGLLDQAHFKPKELNDDFSRQAFDYYLKYIDGNKRFLTQKDVDQLKIHYTEIDNQAKARSLEFFELSLDIIEKGIERSKQYYSEIISQPFELDTQEYYELDGEKKEYAADEEALKMNWRKNLKYEVVNRLRNKIKDLEKKEEAYDLVELEKEVREDVKDLYDDWYKRLDKLRRSDRFEAYLNTFTHLFDPHSDYFNPKGKQDFDIRMGGKLEGIGARLTESEEYTKIASIVPGGPAWRGKELEVDDVILEVQQEGKEGVDIFGMRIDDVVQMIRGKKGTVVYLTVRKQDNTNQKIKIVRDEVIIDESFARSLILDVPGVIENIGYIKLPSFYSSFEGKDGNSSAIDVKKEIEKLKQKNVNGIILDLRYNGGGSLRDVVDMSGLFIEDGPIVQVKPRNRKPFVYEDDDAKVHWDGPLMVMVNSYSASASEILAAALQDYDRAIIVGSNSTFGKGSVQRFYDLDRAIRGANDFKPLGQIKLTMQLYYRINGESVQLRGVEPDVILPDRFSHIGVGEKEYDFAMDWSEINGVEFSQDVYRVENIEFIKQKSKDRVARSEDFQMIDKDALRLKNVRETTKYPLNLQDYISMQEEREIEAKKFNKLLKDPIENLKISNLEVDLPEINLDESRIGRNEDWITQVKKDLYLEEALYILRDMITDL